MSPSGGALQRVAVLLFTATACSPPSTELVIPAVAGESKSALVLVMNAARRDVVSAHALDLEDARTPSYASELDDAVHIVALVYDVSLDTLGVPAGAVMLPSQRSPGRPVPAPVEAYERHVTSDDDGEWSSVADVDALLEPLRLPLADCPEFTPVVIPWTHEKLVSFAGRIGDRWLVIAQSHDAVWLGDDLSVTPVEFPSDLPIAAGAVLDDGTLLLSGWDALIHARVTADRIEKIGDVGTLPNHL